MTLFVPTHLHSAIFDRVRRRAKKRRAQHTQNYNKDFTFAPPESHKLSVKKKSRANKCPVIAARIESDYLFKAGISQCVYALK